jgi:hypothetical protein
MVPAPDAVVAVLSPADVVALTHLAEEGNVFANKLCGAIWWSNHEVKTEGRTCIVCPRNMRRPGWRALIWTVAETECHRACICEACGSAHSAEELKRSAIVSLGQHQRMVGALCRGHVHAAPGHA